MYFIDPEMVLESEIPLYAHIRSDGVKELLVEHIERCKYYFQKIYQDKNLEEVLERFCRQMDFENLPVAQKMVSSMFVQVVVFHDYGKLNPVFQRKKMKNTFFRESYDGLSNSRHSLLSAIIYLDYFWNEIENDRDKDKGMTETSLTKKDRKTLKRIALELSQVIARHHSDIESMDSYLCCLRSGEVETLLTNLHAAPLRGYKGLRWLNTDKLLRFTGNYRILKQKTTREQDMYSYFFYRLAYSVLVACDYYATTDFMNQVHKEYYGSMNELKKFTDAYNGSELIHSIRTYEKEKHPVFSGKIQDLTEMNDLRCEMFLEAEYKLKNFSDEVIYFLEAPTGGGKSNIAVNLSFHMMQGRKKLFYIYPFNTLVEQNRQTLMKLFPDEQLKNNIVVVNSLTPIRGMENKDENSEDYYEKALLDRQFLNYPFVLTTHVSFFKLLFGDKKEDLFGFLQLSSSVAVLDEIQSYRNSIWAEIIVLLEACAKLMGMKVIIMSATLPNLETLGSNECSVKYLLENSRNYFSHPVFKDRVEISYELLQQTVTLELIKQHVKSQFESPQGTEKKLLIEFIKKETAYEFYQMMHQADLQNVEIYCITGDDSSAEREKILKPIREKENINILLIATQVIEAGVDIDMDIGYKDISKLDSEEQFMGRINRSCKRSGKVYFFDLDPANRIYRDDYRIDSDLTLKSEEMQEILLEKTFNRYYRKVLEALQEDRNQSTNREGLQYFFKENVKLLDYPGVAKHMQLIEDEQWSMNIVLCRQLVLENGMHLDGWEIWNKYKKLLQNTELPYAEKQIKLSEVRSWLNYFIYRIKYNVNLAYQDQIGELYCLEDGEKYFNNGKLDRKRLETTGILFLD